MRPIVIYGHSRPLTWLQFNSSGDLFYSCAKDNYIRAWYTETGQALGVFSGHNGVVWSLDVDYKTTRLLSGGGDLKAILWDAKTGDILDSWEEENTVRCVGFATGDKKCLVVVSGGMGKSGELKIYDINKDKVSREPVWSIKGLHGAKPLIARWTSLNESIISSGEDNKLAIWDVETGQMKREILAHDQAIRSWQFNRNKTFLITSSADKTAKIFDVRNLELIKTFQADRPLNAACVSPIKFHALLGGGQSAESVTTSSSKQGKFESLFYHTIYEELIGTVKSGHFGPINALSFSPDGKTFVSGGEDGTLRVHHLDRSYASLPN